MSKSNLEKELEELFKSDNKVIDEKTKKTQKITSIIFLTGITSIFLLSGFSASLATIRKNNAKTFASASGNHNHEGDGAKLALRALGWGSLYSTVGCGFLFYGIWKLSGATSFEDFRRKMRIFPRYSQTDT